MFTTSKLMLNILSSVLYLPLVMLDLVVVDSMGAQCVLSMTVSHMIASLSMMSTLAIAVDQYLAILHALRYHHHITRIRSSLVLSNVWIMSSLTTFFTASLPSTMMWGCCAEYPKTWDPMPNMIISVTITTIIFLIPATSLTIIYSKIFLEAHSSSERT